METRRVLQTDHTVPYGTGPALPAFLAINCQATIVLSLRDDEDQDETKEIRVYAVWLYIPLIEQNRHMARTQRRSLGTKDGKRIDSVLDDRLRLFAVGRLDRKSRDKLLIELAKNPAWVDRLAEHLHASSPL